MPTLKTTVQDESGGVTVYGLVNKAVEDLAHTVGGPQMWAAIRAQAQVDAPTFIGMDQYPDEVTYRLVAAASEVLQMPAEQVLETFGEHWVLYTAQEGYGPLLDLAGSTLPGFLMHLDAMHARVALTLPELTPPSFECTDVTEHGLRLHYRSARQGLEPMVVGLLRGLGRRFGVEIAVAHVERRADGAAHDVFSVTYG